MFAPFWPSLFLADLAGVSSRTNFGFGREESSLNTSIFGFFKPPKRDDFGTFTLLGVAVAPAMADDRPVSLSVRFGRAGVLNESPVGSILILFTPGINSCLITSIECWRL